MVASSRLYSANCVSSWARLLERCKAWSKEFDAWTAKELPGINQALAAKGQAKIEPLTRDVWEKAGDEGGAPGGKSLEEESFRERD